MIKIRDNIFIIIGFLIYIGISFLTFRDYGISCDEQQQRLIGLVNWNYIFNQNNELLSFGDRFYGPLWELFLIAAERICELESLRSIFYLRHVLGNVLFVTGAYFFYRTALDLDIKRWLASLLTLVLLTQPEIYTHSFFNSKDIPFLSFVMITAYFWVRYTMKGQNKSHLIWFGVFAGITASLRLIGGAWFGVYMLYVLLESKRLQKGTIKQVLKLGLLFVVILFLSWPILWSSPIKNFYWGLYTMLNFGFGDLQLYRGAWLSANNLPWHYLSTYFVFKNVEAFVVLFLISLIIYMVKKIKGERVFSNGIGGMYLVMLVFPLIFVSIGNSTKYNGWRHFFFLYPIVLMFISSFLNTRIKGILPLAFVMIAIILQQIKVVVYCHPNGHVYFNSFARESSTSFEVDYWGLTYKQALESILEKNKTSGDIAVYNPEVCGSGNNLLIDIKKDCAIKFVSTESDADFVITQIRTSFKNNLFSKSYFIYAGDEPILCVYRRLNKL